MRIASHVLCIACALILARGADAQDLVKFPTLEKAGPGRLQITGHLYRPRTNSKAPALVILHGCGGQNNTDWQWAEWLAANGYVALAVDSFGPRNRQNICAQPTGHIGYRVPDAFGAALWLLQQPYVDKERVGVMGFSHGGSMALLLATEETRQFSSPSAARFRVSVPIYPGGCGIPAMMRDMIAWRIRIPTLILHGAKDDWTPAAPCKAWVDEARKRRDPVSIIIYPNARHSFDWVGLPISRRDFPRGDGSGVRGVTIGGNQEARDAARRDLLVFLKESL